MQVEWLISGNHGLRCLAGALAGCGLALAVTGLRSQAAAEDVGDGAGLAAVDLTEVLELAWHELSQRRQWGGVTEALRSVLVQAPMAGRVTGLEQRVGDRVAPGDGLLRIEDPALVARVAVLRERVDLLDAELSEWEQLAAAGAAGSAEVSAARLEALAAREQLAEAEARLEAGLVRAATAGRLVDVAVASGADVTPGQQLLVLEVLESVGLRLRLPVTEMRWLEQGRLRLETAAGDELETAGWTALSAANGFVTVEFEGLPVAPAVEARLVSDLHDQVLLVPWTAVASDDDGHWVMVVAGDDHQLERRQIELARAAPAGIEVAAGLDAGDQVLRYRPRAWRQGQQVQPVKEGAD